jgi:RNA polymerase sigma-70 factor (ECF subfamily)
MPRHAWIDELRSRARRESSADDAGSSGAVADPGGDASGTLSVEQAMACLPEDQRLAVALALIEGLPYKEAAQIIGVPMGTLTSRLARGRQALQQLLGPGGGA